MRGIGTCKKLEGIEVFSDELNHASMIQGIKNANVPCHIFRHNDVDHLRELLNTSNASVPKIIVLESLYSMEGLRSPLKQIISLAKEFNALTYLDEVHSVGLYGKEGRGIAEEQMVSDEVDIINGTLSKAFATSKLIIASPFFPFLFFKPRTQVCHLCVRSTTKKIASLVVLCCSPPNCMQ